VTAAADTIFALSSGAPPAALAIIRISGPEADTALLALTGTLPAPRRATLARIRHPSGDLIDEGLVLRFPGPASATGEDLVELHLHGGRAVVAAAQQALAAMSGLRAADPGEFTRRAFENGRIDLAEAEGLADLLEAETESQRRSALAMAGGALSRKIEEWQQRLLILAAQIEAELDFSDEEDANGLPTDWHQRLAELRADIAQWLQRPSAERLRDGVRVALAGPPNAGKSSLFNAIVGRDAAITSAIAGTTRDVVEASTAIGGIAFVLADTAGLRESVDAVETIGVERAHQAAAIADILLWLGAAADCPPHPHAILVQSKIDIEAPRPDGSVRVSAITGEGISDLVSLVTNRATSILPRLDEVAVNRRQRDLLQIASAHLERACTGDLLLDAEELRLARASLDAITGRAGVEHMLDALFSRFCIGK
jgi:tRNA modification GTPase